MSYAFMRGMLPATVTAELGEIMVTLSPTCRPIRLARRVPSTTAFLPPKSSSVPCLILSAMRPFA